MDVQVSIATTLSEQSKYIQRNEKCPIFSHMEGNPFTESQEW